MPLEFEPIGTYTSTAAFKQQAPRQGVFVEGGAGGIIRLKPGNLFEQALRDLEGFDRIWVIFCFDRNQHWRPTTRPPIPPLGRDRVGVFASRSPYRPNPIGLSAVRLLSIKGLELQVAEADLLDGTPILDLKPYIPRYDAFPAASTGWLTAQDFEEWDVQLSPLFSQQSAWIISQNGPDLTVAAKAQLACNPFDASRKRVEQISVEANAERQGLWSFRTWRIYFHCQELSRRLYLDKISSGYQDGDFENKEDPYQDKDLHRAFQLQTFEVN